jgi:hypothetical protein
MNLETALGRERGYCAAVALAQAAKAAFRRGVAIMDRGGLSSAARRDLNFRLMRLDTTDKTAAAVANATIQEASDRGDPWINVGRSCAEVLAERRERNPEATIPAVPTLGRLGAIQIPPLVIYIIATGATVSVVLLSAGMFFERISGAHQFIIANDRVFDLLDRCLDLQSEGQATPEDCDKILVSARGAIEAARPSFFAGLMPIVLVTAAAVAVVAMIRRT